MMSDICPSAHPSIRPPLPPWLLTSFIYPSTAAIPSHPLVLDIHPHVHLSIHPSICLFIRPFIHLSIRVTIVSGAVLGRSGPRLRQWSSLLTRGTRYQDLGEWGSRGWHQRLEVVSTWGQWGEWG